MKTVKRITLIVWMIVIGLVALKPYYTVSADEVGFALSVRTSTQAKFSPLFVIR